MPEIEEVYVLYGDFGNIGSGKILGVFADEERANKASIGCGSLDCGGNGYVEKGYAVQLDDKFYVLKSNTGFVKDKVLPSESRNHSNLIVTIFAYPTDRKINLIKTLRAFCGFSLIGAKLFIEGLPWRVGIDSKVRHRHQLVKNMEEMGVELQVELTNKKISEFKDAIDILEFKDVKSL